MYNKLVRDNIPSIIEEDNKKVKTKVLSTKEYKLELHKKLVEEAKELRDLKPKDDIIEELADVYEVLETILMEHHIDIRDVQNKRIKKNMEKGAFENKVFLESVED